MAVRNSPANRVPGSPLAGVLRHTARAARSTTRRSVAVPGPQGDTGPRGPAGPPPPGPVTILAGDYSTDQNGQVNVPFGTAVDFPTIVATPVLSSPGSLPVIATVAQLGNYSATLVAYGLDGATTVARLHVAVFGNPVPEATPVDLPEQPETEGH